MYQTATLVRFIGKGLPSRAHPRGGSVYLLRDEAEFLYIGKTTNAVWSHLAQHIRSDDLVGRTVRSEAPLSSFWRIEVCILGGEQGLAVVERELIRRYRPRINHRLNTGRPRTDVERLQLMNRRLIGPSCLALIDHGWPSFDGIPLVTPRSRKGG